MKEEYTCDTYPSIGKKYNGEKAIISLTSWKKRINTVSKTIYSLIKNCPGFHIVLVLSEEEFPEKTLPNDLKLFVANNLIEVLWVYKNYKVFKKFIFTMNKYKTVPIICADDDCLYLTNYAEDLYNTWLKCPNMIINRLSYINSGQGLLFPPNCFNGIDLLTLKHKHLNLTSVDCYILALCKKLKIQIYFECKNKITAQHTNISPIDMSRFTKKEHKKLIMELYKKLC